MCCVAWFLLQNIAFAAKPDAKQVHVLSSGLKAAATWTRVEVLQNCRCGMGWSARLPRHAQPRSAAHTAKPAGASHPDFSCEVGPQVTSAAADLCVSSSGPCVVHAAVSVRCCCPATGSAVVAWASSRPTRSVP